ncbi:MAG: hypothetical protein ACK5GM_01455, partial [Bacteroidota bacterium]
MMGPASPAPFFLYRCADKPTPRKSSYPTTPDSNTVELWGYGKMVVCGGIGKLLKLQNQKEPSNTKVAGPIKKISSNRPFFAAKTNSSNPPARYNPKRCFVYVFGFIPQSLIYAIAGALT